MEHEQLVLRGWLFFYAAQPVSERCWFWSVGRQPIESIAAKAGPLPAPEGALQGLVN